MKRRDLLAGLALATVGTQAQTPAEAAAAAVAESLYIPKPQLVDDRRFLLDDQRSTRLLADPRVKAFPPAVEPRGLRLVIGCAGLAFGWSVRPRPCTV